MGTQGEQLLNHTLLQSVVVQWIVSLQVGLEHKPSLVNNPKAKKIIHKLCVGELADLADLVA